MSTPSYIGANAGILGRDAKIEAVSFEPGTVVAGDFKVGALIARGGMGEVYVAEQASTGKQRALKLMKPELVDDEALLARFEQEARIGSRIESDHIVEVVGAGIDPTLKVPWLAMELLQGENLNQLLARRGPLPPNETRVLVAQMVHALAAAHRAGVVHRDLKPENVFVARVRELGVDFKVKILDFGIAKLFEDAQPSKTGVVSLGTPRYMAPEQTGGQPITPQTDVWALGLIVFQVLTGQFYWKRGAGGPNESVMSLMREVLFEPLVSASRRANDYGVPGLIPPGFDAWFARCVAREPRERYRDAGEAGAALDPILATARPSYPHGGVYSSGRPSAPQVAGVTAFQAPHSGAYAPVPAPFAARPSDAGANEHAASTQQGVAGSLVPPRHSAAKAKQQMIMGLAIGALFLVGAGTGAYLAFSDSGKSKKTRVADDDRRSRDDDDDDDPKPSSLKGTYDAQGTEPNGRSYTAKTTIGEGSTSDGFNITWSTGNDGVLLQKDDLIVGSWGTGKFGVSVYDVDRGRLKGTSMSSTFQKRQEELQGLDGLRGVYLSPTDPDVGMLLVPTGETYLVDFDTKGGDFEGVGILVDKKLVVGWCEMPGCGVIAYKKKGARLEGTWAARNAVGLGKETLTRR